MKIHTAPPAYSFYFVAIVCVSFIYTHLCNYFSYIFLCLFILSGYTFYPYIYYSTLYIDYLFAILLYTRLIYSTPHHFHMRLHYCAMHTLQKVNISHTYFLTGASPWFSAPPEPQTLHDRAMNIHSTHLSTLLSFKYLFKVSNHSRLVIIRPKRHKAWTQELRPER